MSQLAFGSESATRLEGAMVVTVRVVVTGLPFGVTETGENAQLAPVGSPPQVNDTAWLKPFCGVMVRVKLAACPCLTVEVSEDGLLSKSGTPAIPRPASAICSGRLMALPLTSSDPVRSPLPPGLKTTFIEQPEPAATLGLQFCVTEKSPALVPLSV